MSKTTDFPDKIVINQRLITYTPIRVWQIFDGMRTKYEHFVVPSDLVDIVVDAIEENSDYFAEAYE